MLPALSTGNDSSCKLKKHLLVKVCIKFDFCVTFSNFYCIEGLSFSTKGATLVFEKLCWSSATVKKQNTTRTQYGQGQEKRGKWTLARTECGQKNGWDIISHRKLGRKVLKAT